MEGLPSAKLPGPLYPGPLSSDGLLGGQKRPGEPAGLMEKGQSLLVMEHTQVDQ